MKKILCLLFASMLILGGCSSNKDSKGSTFNKSKMINVISREDGSGTRGAFIELFEILEKDSTGKKVDHTSIEAVIARNTEIMLSSVKGDKYGIGYLSLGSMNDSVKGLKINDIEPSVDNIKNGTYEIARSFNVVYANEMNEVTTDFMNFILSIEGQSIIEEYGYIAIESTATFMTNKAEGKIIIGGSSSVGPVMEKLQEAYLKLNSNAKIEINVSDSSTGIKETISGTSNLGMSSRDLNEEELSKLTSVSIGIDGIVVIVNKDNPINNLSKNQINTIFTGEQKDWNLD